MGHCTNRQLSQVYTLAAAQETFVVGGVDGIITDFVLNGGTNITLNFDLTKIGGVTTVRVYTKIAPTDTAALLGSFALVAGAFTSVSTFQSFGPIAAWAVQISAELALGGVIDVAARVE